MKTVDKLWGREVWLVNNDKYCGKILELNVGYSSSYHCHKVKQETFYCLEGAFTLNLEGEHLHLVAGDEPITIYPNQYHSFWANEPTKILEISTQHDERDVFRKNKSHKMTVFCFDLDGVICTTPKADYTESLPHEWIIQKINALYNEGHTVKIYTARGSTTGIDWRALTERQLEEWGVQYHELIMGKPEADIFVDDKGMNIRDWLCD